MKSQFIELEIHKQILKHYLLSLCKKGQISKTHDQNFLFQYLIEQGYEFSDDESFFLQDWLLNVTQLKFIKEIIHQTPDLEELIVHSHMWIQTFSSDRKEFFNPFLSPEDFQFSLELFCMQENILWNETSPFHSIAVTRFDQNFRVTIVHSSLTGGVGSKIFFRSQKRSVFKLSDYKITTGQEELLKDLIRLKKNLIICGATGSGKTSFLRALLSEVNEREHLAILEDTKEITLDSPFITSLLANSMPGQSLKDFCHYALRLRPDRIVLGEMRSHEIVPFLLSINTGHDGMMTSLHANSAIDAIHRLCLLFQVYGGDIGVQYREVLKLVCQGVDFIIFLRGKKVEEILEIKGCEGITPYYHSWT